MKKFFLLVLVFVVALSSFACAVKEDGDNRSSYEKIVDVIKEEGDNNTVDITNAQYNLNLKIRVVGSTIRLVGKYNLNGFYSRIELDLKENKEEYDYTGTYDIEGNGITSFDIAGSILAAQFNEYYDLPYSTYKGYGSWSDCGLSSSEFRLTKLYVRDGIFRSLITFREYIMQKIQIDIFEVFEFIEML